MLTSTLLFDIDADERDTALISRLTHEAEAHSWVSAELQPFIPGVLGATRFGFIGQADDVRARGMKLCTKDACRTGLVKKRCCSQMVATCHMRFGAVDAQRDYTGCVFFGSW